MRYHHHDQQQQRLSGKEENSADENDHIGREDGELLVNNENSLIARQYEQLFNQVCADSEEEGEQEEDHRDDHEEAED